MTVQRLDTSPRSRTPIKRRSGDARVNLSSNELVDPRLDAVYRDLPAALGPAVFTRYPVAAGALADLAGYFGLPDTDSLVMTPGSDVALRLVCGYHRRRPGVGPVILQEPNYVAWREAADQLGLPVLPVAADPADPAAQSRGLLAAARSTTRALIAVSVPNGPLGGILPAAELDELTALARRRGHLLVLDSCYQAFAGPVAEHIARAGGPVLTVQSMSKSHGLAGARVAVLCGEPELLAEIDPGPLEQAVSGPALVAARTAVARHDVFTQIWADVQARRAETTALLRSWGVRLGPPGGNFVTVDLRSAAAATAACDRLSAAGYRIRDLSPLPGLAGHIRFGLADPATHDRFMVVLRAALAGTGSVG